LLELAGKKERLVSPAYIAALLRKGRARALDVLKSLRSESRNSAGVPHTLYSPGPPSCAANTAMR
jgi:hypothetical protein